MTKNNCLLAAYDEKGNFTLLSDPIPYDEARAQLLELTEKGSDKFSKAALVSLRAGIRKRRPVAKKKAPAKKKSPAASKD